MQSLDRILSILLDAGERSDATSITLRSEGASWKSAQTVTRWLATLRQHAANFWMFECSTNFTGGEAACPIGLLRFHRIPQPPQVRLARRPVLPRGMHSL